MIRVLAISLLLILCSTPAAEARIFLELVGQTQGPISGSATFPGEQGRIEVTSWAHGGYVLVQPGQGTVTRSWADVSLAKSWDPSTVRLMRAQGEEEILTTCVFRIYEDFVGAATDSETFERRMPHMYLMVELLGARISSISVSGADSQNAAESLSLTYDAIRYTDPNTGRTFYGAVRGPGSKQVLSTGPIPDPGLDGTRLDPFEFDLTETGPSGIEIVDAEGRWVTTLFADEAAESVRWDGTDAQGRKVAAGVYSATVRTAEAEVTRRMVIGR